MKAKFLCAVLAIFFSFTACENKDFDNEKQQPRVAVLLKAQTNAFRLAIGYYATQALEETDLPYVTYIASDADQQAHHVEMAVEAGCEVLIVVPEGIDHRVLLPAVEASIPIVMMEDNAGFDGYAALVKVDNEEVGENAAAYFNRKDVSNLVAFSIEGDPVPSSARLRGLKATLEGTTLVVEKSIPLYTRADGKAGAAEVLADNTEVDAFYAQDDEVAMGVLEAIAEAERDDIGVIVGCGGSQEFFNLILDTTTPDLASILYSPKMMITKCVEIATEILEGNMPEVKDVLMPATIVDKNNAEDYLDENSPY